MKTTLIVCVWAAMSYVNIGWLLAEFQGDWGSHESLKREGYRTDLGFAALLSTLPFAWIVTPFVTGFYQHGWLRPTLHPTETAASSTEPTPEPASLSDPSTVEGRRTKP